MANDELAEEIKRRKYDNYEIVCDSAEPKSIADVRGSGLFARSSYKRPGCVEYRVKWLQHRRIVIDPARTPNAHREFVNYSYRVDKNGEVLPSLVEGNEHSIDATAYALQRVIFSRETSA